MKLLSAKIRGSIGLKKGLGVDEVTLDLSKLSGLIALDGENGRGKSTLLESLSPYPVMPSRKGALQHQFFLKDSFLDREYLFNGDKIRCLVKINGGSNYSPEGFIWINDQPKVEGKISSYKEFIAEIFGSQQLFYNSAFCSQGSENLNDLDPADLKNLFAEFLQLHKYMKWEEIAKGCGKILDGRLAAVEKTISLLEAKKEGNTIAFLIDDAIPSANAEKEKAEKGAAVLTEKVKVQTEKLEAEKKKITENEKLEARAKDIKNSLGQTLRDIEGEGYQSMKELGAVREKAQGIINQIKQHEEVMKDKEQIEKAGSDLEAKNNETILLRAALNQSHEILQNLSTKIGNLEKQRREAVDKSNKEQAEISTTINDLEKTRTENQTKLQKAKDEYNTASLEAELKSLKAQTEILDKRKEDPACPDKDAKCFFVMSAYEALNSIPAIENNIKAMGQALKKAQGEIESDITKINTQISCKQAELRAEQDRLNTDVVNIDNKIIYQKNLQTEETETKRSTQKRLDAIEADIAMLRPIAARADQIKVAEASIKALEDQKESVIKEGISLKEKWDTRLNELRKRETETAALILSIENLIDSEAKSRKQAIEVEIATLNAKLDATRGYITQTEIQIKDLEREAKELEKIEKDLIAAKTEQTTVSNQMSIWRYCQAVCSKDGLRALEIDSVVPNIVHETGELLSASNFGTIKIITQDPDTGREVFKIMIIDDDGDEVPLEVRSGGEKIWPVQALRLGMTLISKQKSTYNYLTAFNDELDGPLDVENAKKFISLYPKFMERGGFRDCFFITHKPQCVDMADHRLIFTDHGIGVE